MGNIINRIQSHSGSDLTIRWAEFIGKEGWTQDISLGAGESRAVMKIAVLWEDLDEAIRQIIGYARKVIGTTALERHVPMRHPRWYWMRAEQISAIQGLSWNGKEVPFGSPISAYKVAVLTVLFKTPNYAVRRDSEMGADGEWMRFVEKNRKSSVEFLMPERGTLKFVEGPASILNKEFRGNRGQINMRTRLTWRWVGVPDDGLFTLGGSERGGVPSRIDSAVGRVNSTEFAGYPAGTLLCEAPEFKPVMYPVHPGYVMAKDFIWDVPRMWDVTLVFVHFDPPYDAAGGFTSRGHNLCPAPVSKFWYKAGTAGSTSYPLYDSTEFADIFKMN